MAQLRRRRCGARHCAASQYAASFGDSPVDALGAGRRKLLTRGFDRPQGDKRLGLLHRGRNWIDDRYADQIPRARRETGERRAGEDSNIGVALRNRFVGKIDERWPVRFARVLQRTEAAIERDNARTAAFEAVHRDAVAIPPAKRARESDDEELSAKHAGCQHRRLGDADHRKIEQFARAEEARIAEGRKDRGVKPLGFREHLKSDCAADLSLGAACDIGETPRRRDGVDLDARRSHCAPGVEHERGDRFSRVRIEDQDAHEDPAVHGAHARISQAAARVSSRSRPGAATACTPTGKPLAPVMSGRL